MCFKNTAKVIAFFVSAKLFSQIFSEKYAIQQPFI